MSYEEKITAAIEGATKDAEGKTVFSEDVSEDIAYMANLELRRRDTQGALSKSRAAQEALEAENNLLASSLESSASGLTPEQQSGLEELKHSDPDAWRAEVNKLELENKAAAQEARNKVRETAKAETELERRTRVLDEYNKANPNAQLTDDVIQNDIPPRITKKFQAGEITFDEFLAEASSFITTPKVLDPGTPAPDASPDLGNLGGAAAPSGKAVDSDIISTYNQEIY